MKSIRNIDKVGNMVKMEEGVIMKKMKDEDEKEGRMFKI